MLLRPKFVYPYIQGERLSKAEALFRTQLQQVVTATGWEGKARNWKQMLST